MSSLANDLNSFSFEINAFNLVRNAYNCQMIIADAKKYILFKNGPNSKSDNEQHAKKVLKVFYDAYVAENSVGSSGENSIF